MTRLVFVIGDHPDSGEVFAQLRKELGPSKTGRISVPGMADHLRGYKYFDLIQMECSDPLIEAVDEVLNPRPVGLRWFYGINQYRRITGQPATPEYLNRVYG